MLPPRQLPFGREPHAPARAGDAHVLERARVPRALESLDSPASSAISVATLVERVALATELHGMRVGPASPLCEVRR